MGVPLDDHALVPRLRLRPNSVNLAATFAGRQSGAEGAGHIRRKTPFRARERGGAALLRLLHAVGPALQIDGGGAKKHRREPSGFLQRQHWPSRLICTSLNGTTSLSFVKK